MQFCVCTVSRHETEIRILISIPVLLDHLKLSSVLSRSTGAAKKNSTGSLVSPISIFRLCVQNFPVSLCLLLMKHQTKMVVKYASFELLASLKIPDYWQCLKQQTCTLECIFVTPGSKATHP